MTLYKALDASGQSCNGGFAQWSLPVQNADGVWTPGEWMPAIEGELIACENGYHLAKDVQVLEWLNTRLFVAEYRGERLDADSKVVVREVRLVREIVTWTERTARLFAVWCARGALKLISNPDPRSVAACDVAERYANGEATVSELAAAWDAARYVGWDAAMYAAWDTAWDAARDAGWYAARYAVRDTAWDAARDAQYQHLMEMLGEKDGDA